MSTFQAIDSLMVGYSPPKAGSNNEQLAQQAVQAIAQNQLRMAAVILRQLANESKDLPQQWLLDTAYALETNDCDVLSKGFINQKFVGCNGAFLMIAPYKVRREADESIKLTAILGQVIPFSLEMKGLKAIISKEFGELRQSIPIILPYEQYAACGNVGGESEEAFVVANNWQFINSVQGPSLNNTLEQRRRFLDSGQKCIRKIWEKDSAELLVAPLIDEITETRYRSLEYQLHELGHASGLGLEHKVNQGLFREDYWNAAIEESRSDGVELWLASKALPEEEAGKVVAANLCVRQALDAHRRGGLNRDADVGASLLNFSQLWNSGEIGIRNGRLYLRDLSYRALLRATEPHRQWCNPVNFLKS